MITDFAIEDRFRRLNELWQKIEAKLLKMAPPRSIHGIYKEEGGMYYFIGLRKIHNKWRVSIAESKSSDHKRATWTAITTAPKTAQLAAVGGLNMLMEEIRKTNTEYLPRLDQAIKNLEDAIGPSEDPPEEYNNDA